MYHSSLAANKYNWCYNNLLESIKLTVGSGVGVTLTTVVVVVKDKVVVSGITVEVDGFTDVGRIIELEFVIWGVEVVVTTWEVVDKIVVDVVEVVVILVMLELGEGVKDISELIEVVGANTILIDSDIETELVDCGTLLERVEVVINVVEGGTVVGKIVVNAIIVDVGSKIEVVEGSGISHNWYSQEIENELVPSISGFCTCSNITVNI